MFFSQFNYITELFFIIIFIGLVYIFIFFKKYNIVIFRIIYIAISSMLNDSLFLHIRSFQIFSMLLSCIIKLYQAFLVTFALKLLSLMGNSMLNTGFKSLKKFLDVNILIVFFNRVSYRSI